MPLQDGYYMTPPHNSGNTIKVKCFPPEGQTPIGYRSSEILWAYSFINLSIGNLH
jgi:hypothetical protein